MNPTRLLWLCNIGMMCVALGSGSLPVYLTTFSEEFGGLTEARLGQIPGALFAGFVLGILLSGPLADRLGGKPFALLGLGLSVGGLLLAAGAPIFGLLLAAAFLLGLGNGIVDMLMSPVVAAVSTDRRAAALNHLHAFYSVGAVGTVLIATGGLYLGVPWRAVLVVLALLPAACFLGFAFESLPPLVAPGEQRHRLRQLLRSPRFHAAVLIMFFIGATEEGMAQWLPAYAERGLGYPKSTAGAALAAFSICQGVGRLLGASRFNLLSPHRLLTLAAGATGACYLLAAWAPLPLVGLLGCVCCGLAGSVLWPTHLAITSDRIPQGGASMFGLLAAAGNLGCTFAPWAEGVVAGRTTLHTALFIAATAPLLLTALAMLLLQWDRAPASPRQP